ncbi:hypothetical protein KC19_8G074700 [Ceratodon purpureus]|uniref:Uncharacterized protein n=1 Tax=Ceratodon purpureus TaxID=3225 RepID=A0A8T0H1P6_CERPU|nr:hypothetical protein KC19_8G074700 [Ceratodon purpureus]
MANRSWVASVMFASKCAVSPLYFHEGKTKVDPHLASLMECEVVVKKISIYKTPLRTDLRQASAAQLNEQQGAGSSWTQLHHHFLIVEVSSPPHLHIIRAEKSGLDPEGFAGITVNIVPFIVEGKAAKEHHGRVVNLPIQLKKLIEILTAHHPDYDLLCDNCWKYADNTFKALEDTLRATTGSTEVQRQGQSQQLLANEGSMPPLIMPIERITQAAKVTTMIVSLGVLTTCAYKGLKWWMTREDEVKKEEVPAKQYCA